MLLLLLPLKRPPTPGYSCARRSAAGRGRAMGGGLDLSDLNSLCVVVVSAWVLGGWQCLVWLLGVCMMVVLFAEGHRDVEPMSQEALLEMKSLHRKRE